MSKDEKMVRVFFSLECEDDWPPVSVESVWARSTNEPHHYLIENTPFFVLSATLGDLVVANHRLTSDKSEADVLWFQERVKWGGNALIRLIVRQKEVEDEIVAWLHRNGCVCERFNKFSMVAVSIPREVDQKFIQEHLLQHEEAGNVYVEEAILR
jgi:hypothetical protein